MGEDTEILNKKVIVSSCNSPLTRAIKELQIKNRTTWRLTPGAYRVLKYRSGSDLEIAVYILFKVVHFPEMIITSGMINKATKHKITRESAEFLIWKKACELTEERGTISEPQHFIFRR